jgi:K+-transporting ATPase ATPase C chain
LLVDRVDKDVAAARKAFGAKDALPGDLVTASASGLDPDISVESALLQAPAVAAARGLDAAKVRALVEAKTEGRQWGFLGESRVNVLSLNLALEDMK